MLLRYVVPAHSSFSAGCLTGEVVDQRALACRNRPCPGTEDDCPIGFEFEVESAVAGSAQPVVLHRHSRGRRANCSYHSPITQIVKFLTACWIEALGQHRQLLPSFSAQPCLDAIPTKRFCCRECNTSELVSKPSSLQPRPGACILVASEGVSGFERCKSKCISCVMFDPTRKEQANDFFSEHFRDDRP
jgi:hypothetical protein